jgi:DNA/RNA-binding domain of Phe-tRNA-synthetase-like protein
MDITVHPDLQDKADVLALEISPVSVKANDPDLTEELRSTTDALASEHRGRNPSEIPGVEKARKLYRSVGIDPTRRRPSSEALLRRVLRGKPFPRVNTLVDCVNLLSVRFLLPYGLYDLGTLRPPIEFRMGKEGEWYAGIRKDRVGLKGKPALFDREGPFGNPTSDSDRAKITLQTTAALVVCFHPAGMAVGEIGDESRRVIERFCISETQDWTRGR